MRPLQLLLATVMLGVLLLGAQQLWSQRPTVVQSWPVDMLGEGPRNLRLEVVTQHGTGTWDNWLRLSCGRFIRRSVNLPGTSMPDKQTWTPRNTRAEYAEGAVVVRAPGRAGPVTVRVPFQTPRSCW